MAVCYTNAVLKDRGRVVTIVGTVDIPHLLRRKVQRNGVVFAMKPLLDALLLKSLVV